MKKITTIILMIALAFLCTFSTVYATQNEVANESLKSTSTGKLQTLKERELERMEYKKQEYGSETYGMTAYILDKIRWISIPLFFIGIAFSAIYQYVIGLKRLDIRDKGFNSMIAIMTIFIICQLLPLIFTIVVTMA